MNPLVRPRLVERNDPASVPGKQGTRMLRMSDRSLGLLAIGALLASMSGHDLSACFHRVAGDAATRLGSHAAADRHLTRAVRSSRRQAADGLAEDLLRLGTHYWRTGRLHDARRVLEQATGLYPDDPGFDRPRRSMILLALIDVYDGLGRLDEALAAARELLGLAEKRLGEDDLLIAGVLDTLADLHARHGELGAAEESLRRALSIRESRLGGTHPEVAATLTRLGRLIAEQGDLDGARLYLERSVSILRSPNDAGGSGAFQWFAGDDGEREAFLLEALNELGLIHIEQRRSHEAWLLFEEAIALQVGAMPQRLALLINAANVLLRLGRAREALFYAELALASEVEVAMSASTRRSLAAGAENARSKAIRSLSDGSGSIRAGVSTGSSL